MYTHLSKNHKHSVKGKLIYFMENKIRSLNTIKANQTNFQQSR